MSNIFQENIDEGLRKYSISKKFLDEFEMPFKEMVGILEKFLETKVGAMSDKIMSDENYRDLRNEPTASSLIAALMLLKMPIAISLNISEELLNLHLKYYKSSHFKEVEDWDPEGDFELMVAGLLVYLSNNLTLAKKAKERTLGGLEMLLNVRKLVRTPREKSIIDKNVRQYYESSLVKNFWENKIKEQDTGGAGHE